jgi:hypothetical protein
MEIHHHCLKSSAFNNTRFTWVHYEEKFEMPLESISITMAEIHSDSKIDNAKEFAKQKHGWHWKS